MGRSVCLFLGVLALGALAGCGDEAPSGSASDAAGPRASASLTRAERSQADTSVAAIRGYCRRLAAYLAGRAREPGPDRAVLAARRIAALANAKPGARYEGSQTARDLAADLAEDLEGTNCSARLVAELSRGLGP